MTPLDLLWRFRGYVALAAFLLTAWAWHHVALREAYRAGAAAARAEIDAANRAAAEKANEAARTLAECPLGMWDRETGTCAR